MKTFEKKIKKIKSTRLITATIAFAIAIIIFILAIIQVLPKEIDYMEFNKNKKLSNNAKTTVYYLIGPLVTVKDKNDNSDISAYYIAVGEEKNLFIIKLKEDNISIPVLGKDIEEDSVDTLDGVVVYGSVQLSSYSIRDKLNNRINKIFNDDIVNNNVFDKMFGAYYLDTINNEKDNPVKLFILSLLFAIIGIIYILINKRVRSNTNNTINELKSKGKFEEVKEEFESGKLIKYRKLKVDLSSNYIFSYCSSLDVIAFKDISEVYTYKNTLGNSNRGQYIAITTKDEKQYYIAPMKKKKQKIIFNELLAKIKATIE